MLVSWSIIRTVAFISGLAEAEEEKQRGGTLGFPDFAGKKREKSNILFERQTVIEFAELFPPRQQQSAAQMAKTRVCTHQVPKSVLDRADNALREARSRQ